MKPTTVMNACEAAVFAASRFVADAELVTLDALLRRRPALDARPRVFVTRVEPGQATDITALGRLHSGGMPPLTVAPFDFASCVTMAATAALFSRLAGYASVVLLEHEIAELEGMPQEPDQVKPGPFPPAPPIDPLLPAPHRDLLLARHKLSQAPTIAQFDPDPTPGVKAEWLVISFGSSVGAAAEAVSQSRATGQRVSHLRLGTLWPFPEESIHKAAAGVKHVVVPERNLGQYLDEIRRVLPMQTVIPANAVPGPVPAALILDRLANTPRCC